MVANVIDRIGLGIYTPSEAARYARVHTSTMSRWIHGDCRGLPAVDAQLANNEERVVTFLDFVQALAVRAIRHKERVPLDKIREAIQNAKKYYNLEYPLARKHTTYLFRGEVYVRLEVEDENEFSQVSGVGKGQLAHNKVIELYMENLSFDDESGLADEYKPFLYRDREVRINPKIRFGQPIVEPCGYSAEALIDAVETEGGIESAAHVYGVDPDDVRAAIAYDDYLRGPSA